MTQYEQENDFGRGGGEVDDETMEKAWQDSERRLGGPDVPGEGAEESEQEGPGPWAKTSSGDADEV